MENRPILKNKYYLYLTEFFAGMSVMAVELGASRLLAPYFSSSQIVWTIIIGTIMIEGDSSTVREESFMKRLLHASSEATTGKRCRPLQCWRSVCWPVAKAKRG